MKKDRSLLDSKKCEIVAPSDKAFQIAMNMVGGLTDNLTTNLIRANAAELVAPFETSAEMQEVSLANHKLVYVPFAVNDLEKIIFEGGGATRNNY